MAKVAELPLDARLAYSISDAALALGGLSKSTVYELVRRGELELGKLAGRSVIRTENLKAYLERNYKPVRGG